MDERHDIEETLKRFRHDTDGRAKDAVMSTYRNAMAGAGALRERRSFWKRPVPLYAAAAALVVMVGISFMVGQRTSRAEAPAAAIEFPAATDAVVTSDDLEWSVAERDLL